MEKVEEELSEIRALLMKLEIMLIGDEEEIDDESKRMLEKRLEEAFSGNIISLEDMQREINVQD